MPGWSLEINGKLTGPLHFPASVSMKKVKSLKKRFAVSSGGDFDHFDAIRILKHTLMRVEILLLNLLYSKRFLFFYEPTPSRLWTVFHSTFISST